MAQELVPCDKHWEGASAFRSDLPLRDGSRSGLTCYMSSRNDRRAYQGPGMMHQFYSLGPGLALQTGKAVSLFARYSHQLSRTQQRSGIQK